MNGIADKLEIEADRLRMNYQFSQDRIESAILCSTIALLKVFIRILREEASK